MKKLIIILGLSSLMGCGPSTEIVKSWRDPAFNDIRKRHSKNIGFRIGQR